MSIMTAMPQGAAVEGINPNLLDNWYFVGGGTGNGVFPVNQRGLTSFSSAGYTIDRWTIYNYSGTVSAEVSADGIHFTASNSNLRQHVDVPLNLLAGRTVTLSAIVDGVLYTASAVIPTTFSQTSNVISITFTGGNVGLFSRPAPVGVINRYTVAMSGNSVNSTVVFTAIKLEFGDTQTLAHQENGVWVLNEIPNYEEQLLRCQTSTVDSNDRYVNQTVMTNYRASNLNLLDNWYFVGGGTNDNFPINQRGKTIYNGQVYSFDRWQVGTATNITNPSLTLGNNGIALSGALWQHIELSRIPTGTRCCLSCLYSDGTLMTNSGVIDFSNGGWQIISGTLGTNAIAIRPHTSNNVSCWQITVWNSNSNNGIVAMKLEIGDTQTLCHQENGAWALNEIPNYAEELAKCQRYLLIFKSITDTYCFISFANGSANNNAVVIVPTPVSMRDTPGVTFEGAVVLSDRTANARYSVTSIVPNGTRLAVNSVSFVVATGTTVAGRLYEFAIWNDSAGRLVFSSEL